MVASNLISSPGLRTHAIVCMYHTYYTVCLSYVNGCLTPNVLLAMSCPPGFVRTSTGALVLLSFVFLSTRTAELLCALSAMWLTPAIMGLPVTRLDGVAPLRNQ